MKRRAEGMKTGAIVLSAVGVLIIVAIVFTPLTFFAPYYALFWAIACFIVAGVLSRQMTKSK